MITDVRSLQIHVIPCPYPTISLRYPVRLGLYLQSAIAMSVRKTPPSSVPGFALTKRARVNSEEAEEDGMMTLTVASSGQGQRKNALIRTVKRTSGLEAPIVALSGAHAVSLPHIPAFINRLMDVGRGDGLQIRSYRAEIGSMFGRQKYMCIRIPSRGELLTGMQRCGTRFPLMTIMVSCRMSINRPSSI